MHVITVGVSPMSRPWKIIIITETVVDHACWKACTWATGLMNRYYHGKYGHRDKSLIFCATCEAFFFFCLGESIIEISNYSSVYICIYSSLRICIADYLGDKIRY